MKTFIYCTKAKPYLTDMQGIQGELLHRFNTFNHQYEDRILNGKVVAQFELDNIYKLVKHKFADAYHKPDRYEPDVGFNWIMDNSCLTDDKLWDYGKGKDLYAWHIKDLTIIEPLELSEFEKDSKKGLKGYNWSGININFVETITKAPQSWQYAYYKGERVLLMSIKSKWCEKILNGEKTIKVRKTAPREVLK